LLPFLVVGPVGWIGRASIKGYGLGIVAAAIVVGAAISVTASLYVQSRLTVLDVNFGGESVMTKYSRRIVVTGLAGTLMAASLPGPVQAETGAVRVVFTKGGFIIGVGGGEGVLTFRGNNYPFSVSGMSVGFTIGASTTKLVGRALNIRSPGDIAGSYAVIGAGGALAAGAGGVQLQNEKGVILQLHGPKVGVELSAAVGGVSIALR